MDNSVLPSLAFFTMKFMVNKKMLRLRQKVAFNNVERTKHLPCIDPRTGRKTDIC